MGETKKGRYEKRTKFKVTLKPGKFEKTSKPKSNNEEPQLSTKTKKRNDAIQDVEDRIFASIDQKVEKLNSHLEKLEEEVNGENKIQTGRKNKDAVDYRITCLKVRTEVGKFKAKAAVKMNIILARYHKLKGNTERQEELLKKARQVARKKIFELQNKNQNVSNNIRKMAKNRNDEIRDVEESIFASIDNDVNNLGLHLQELSEELSFDPKNMSAEKISDPKLEDVVTYKIIISKARTEVGKFKAKAAVKMNTILARYHKLMGNDEKKEELLSKAGSVARTKMSTVKNTEREDTYKIRRIVRKTNEVRIKTDNYSLERKMEADLESRRKEAEATLIKGRFDKKKDKKEKRKARIMKTAKEKIANAVDKSDRVGEFMYNTATDAAIMGLNPVADFIAEHSAAVTTSIFKRAERINERAYARVNRKPFGFKDQKEKCKKATIELLGKIAQGMSVESTIYDYYWGEMVANMGTTVHQRITGNALVLSGNTNILSPQLRGPQLRGPQLRGPQSRGPQEEIFHE